MTPRYQLFPLKQNQSAEAAVRHWLAGQFGMTEEALALTRDARNRPRLGGSLHGWDVSWSHSSGYLLAALGKGMRVGCDIESPRREVKELLVARRYFSLSETQWLEALPTAERKAAFFRLWCAKEAVLKAHGGGLSFGLDKPVLAMRNGILQLASCHPSLGQVSNWRIQELALAADLHGCLAWHIPA